MTVSELKKESGAQAFFPLFESIERQCLPEIERNLSRFFTKKENEGLSWISQMSEYHLSTGGKRLRALIPCWVFAACGNDPMSAVPLGCALELMHNATLVHDDLQDGDAIRRGKPTVWKRYSPAQAINCGDALFFFALDSLYEMKISPQNLKAVQQRLTRGILEVIEGQGQELLMKDEMFPDWERYTGVIKGKTAALIATAVVAALEALNAPEDVCRWAEATATRSGMLFQIQDDLLDIYGDKQRGQRGADIAEGKISALVAAFNELASGEPREEMAKVLQRSRDKVTIADIDEVILKFETSGAKDLVISRMKDLKAPLAPPSHWKAALPMVAFFQEMNQKFLMPIGDLCA